MLRPAIFVFAAAAMALQAHAAELGIARPGGAYITIAAADADACARLCAADGLCMAWTLRAGACELKATAPNPVADTSATSGLSSRAPALARLVPLPAAAEPAPGGPAPMILALATTSQTLAPDDGALLGGPEAEDASLRPRLGGRP